MDEADVGQTEPQAHEPEGLEGLGPAIVLALAAVVAAVLFGRASFLSADASDAWQRALREEIKRAAAVTEDVRYVYSDEAPLAFAGVSTQVRAQEHRSRAEQASGRTQRLLLAEAGTNDVLLETLAGGSFILADEKYARDDGSYDLGLRLADVRQENPDLVDINPDELQAVGDRANRRASTSLGAAALAPFAFLLGSLAQVFRRRRTPLLIAGALVLGLSVVIGVLSEVGL